MPTLTLTPAERNIFRLLPESVTAGWTVQMEDRAYDESPIDARARQVSAEFESAKLKEWRDRVRAATTDEEVSELAKDIDIDDLPMHDKREMLFVLGPVHLGNIIEVQLRRAKTADDMAGIAEATVLRSALLTAFLSV